MRAIGHREGDRALSDHLEDGAPGVLEAGGNEDGNGRELAQQLAQRIRVLAAGEDLPPQGTQAHHLAADVEVFEEEAFGEVGGRGHREMIPP